jgi:3-polyprenyl-4-hydroxybenzoate decarboxylase
MLAAASKIPYDADELETAGAWQGQSLRVVPAKTVDLMVPADAEMVIEGHVLPHVREEEGPFGEFMDSYVEVGRNHVFRATALTRRSPSGTRLCRSDWPQRSASMHNSMSSLMASSTARSSKRSKGKASPW